MPKLPGKMSCIWIAMMRRTTSSSASLKIGMIDSLAEEEETIKVGLSCPLASRHSLTPRNWDLSFRCFQWPKNLRLAYYSKMPRIISRDRSYKTLIPMEIRTRKRVIPAWWCLRSPPSPCAPTSKEKRGEWPLDRAGSWPLMLLLEIRRSKAIILQ